MQKYYILTIVLFLVGCNTLSGRRTQKLLVRTNNSQDKVIYKGEVLGHSPQWVLLDRAREGQVQIQGLNGQRQAYSLTGKYTAWWENLLFVQAAPVAWLTDWLTGAGYEYQGYGLIKTSSVKFKRARVIAIAPPLAISESISEKIAEKVEDVVRQKYPKAHILKYSETKELFYRHGYFFDHQLGQKQKEVLRFSLPVDFFVETVVRGDAESERGVNAESVVKNLSSERERLFDEWTSTIEIEKKLTYADKIWWKELFWLKPNTVSVDLVSAVPSIKTGGQEIKGKNESLSGDLAKAVNVLGALGLSRWRERKFSTPWRLGFHFVPAFALSYGRLKFEKLKVVEDVVFKRFLISAGYGVRADLSSYFGLFYVDIVPSLNYTRLSWEGETSNGARDKSRVRFISEFGYKYYFSREWSLRLFVKSVEENEELWQKAIDSAAAENVLLDQVQSNYAGLSLEYFFGGYK